MDQSNSDQQPETDNKRQVNELRLQAMRLLIDDGHNLSPSSLHKAIEALSARFEGSEQPEPLNRLSARFTAVLAEFLSDERVSIAVREQFRDAIDEVDRLAGSLRTRRARRLSSRGFPGISG